MSYKRLLTIQDISCVGQCSITVALPVISACGIECAVLPSAVLSTHTGGFEGFTFRDLTEDMPKISEHWRRENITFDAVYTGYLGNAKQIQYVTQIFDTALNAGGLIVVDPAMADRGKLYAGFDETIVSAMASLCARADYVLPNITEACFLTGVEYREEYDRDYINEILEKLLKTGCKNIILTGISYKKGKTGIVVFESGKYSYYEHDYFEGSCHGTGDVYASTFVGAKLRGKSAFDAACIAADFTLDCIKATMEEKNHWYGAAFEKALPKLMEKL